MTDHPAVELARKLRYDLTAIQARVTDLLTILASLDLPEPQQHRCPLCGIGFRARQPLEEHLYVSHSHGVPAHWLEAESRAEEEPA